MILGATGGLSARVVTLVGVLDIHTGRRAASGTRLECNGPSHTGSVTIQACLVDVPWSRDGFRVRAPRFAWKGHTMTTQGNAVGIMRFEPRGPLMEDDELKDDTTRSILKPPTRPTGLEPTTSASTGRRSAS